jgi:diphosphomevalonate decarboxylase
VNDSFEIRSGNNFPSDCGLASSASSFAALTMAADKCFSAILKRPTKAPLELARISKTGSGSSCRSFFGPWCAWEEEEIFAVESKLENLVDVVVALTREAKKISSSDAHRRVASSPLMDRRAERALARQAIVKKALLNGDFKLLAETAWADSWDMHSMFHTSNPPFSYFEPTTISVLRSVERFWEKRGFGPAATIDAGPNVHLIFQAAEKDEFLAEFRGTDFRLLESAT